MGERSLFKWSRSHDQDGCHAHNMVKRLKNLLLWNQKVDDLESLYEAFGTQVLPSLYGKKLKQWIFQKLL